MSTEPQQISNIGKNITIVNAFCVTEMIPYSVIDPLSLKQMLILLDYHILLLYLGYDNYFSFYAYAWLIFTGKFTGKPFS